MKTLIMENDTYLAQSISNKLVEKGYECVIAKDANFKFDKNAHFDVVLMSYDVCTTNCVNIVKLFPNSVVIMMLTYIADESATKMLQAGVYDYIIKPFMIDELVRKIEHYKHYSALKQEVVFYKNYFEFVESILDTPIPFTYNLPFIIRSNSQRSADIYAMRYARLKQIKFEFKTITDIDCKELLSKSNNQNTITYLTGLERLRKSERNDFLGKLNKHRILMSFISKEELAFNNIADITSSGPGVDFGGDILSIKEYEKMVISKYENIYSDIDLAKKLGISRKSLWEKRKRYGIERAKKTK
ncbi:response regulator [Helicobacter sp. 23-1044]